ncbi:MAG: hypothetical protein VB859_18065, partial [Planctomycetaceae bacterium]
RTPPSCIWCGTWIRGWSASTRISYMNLDGEDMGFSMIRDYLAMVGIKDSFHAPNPDGDPAHVPMFTSMRAGSVDWRRALKLLQEIDYAARCPVHTEYQFGE